MTSSQLEQHIAIRMRIRMRMKKGVGGMSDMEKPIDGVVQ